VRIRLLFFWFNQRRLLQLLSWVITRLSLKVSFTIILVWVVSCSF
jgi:hypothetical protein